MRNTFRVFVAVVAATTLATAVFACPGEKTAEAKAGCKDSAAGKTAGGCPHAEAAAMHASDVKSTGGCGGAKATEAQRAALSKGEAVTLVGHVVCASCDLKMANGCKSMFKTEKGDVYALVTNETSEKLTGETRHGEKKVEITGVAAKDGSEKIVELRDFKIVS